MKRIKYWVYLLFCLYTSIVGYNIHKSIFWSIVDFFIPPLVWIKWFIMGEVNIFILKQMFT